MKAAKGSEDAWAEYVAGHRRRQRNRKILIFGVFALTAFVIFGCVPARTHSATASPFGNSDEANP